MTVPTILMRCRRQANSTLKTAEVGKVFEIQYLRAIEEVAKIKVADVVSQNYVGIDLEDEAEGARDSATV